MKNNGDSSKTVNKSFDHLEVVDSTDDFGSVALEKDLHNDNCPNQSEAASSQSDFLLRWKTMKQDRRENMKNDSVLSIPEIAEVVATPSTIPSVTKQGSVTFDQSRYSHQEFDTYEESVSNQSDVTTASSSKSSDSKQGSPTFDRSWYSNQELLEAVQKSKNICEDMERREDARLNEIAWRLFESDEEGEFECDEEDEFEWSDEDDSFLGTWYGLKKPLLDEDRKNTNEENVQSRQPSTSTSPSASMKKKNCAEQVCPLCSKSCSSKQRLNSHLDNKICQKNGKKASSFVQSRKPSTSPSPPASMKKKNSAEHVCPLCSKSFSTKQKKNSHLDNKVCQKNGKKASPSTSLTTQSLSTSGLESRLATDICKRSNVDVTVINMEINVKGKRADAILGSISKGGTNSNDATNHGNSR